MTLLAASSVWSVENTRCPVSDAWTAIRHKPTEEVTLGTIRQWGMSLGLPIKSHGALPKPLDPSSLYQAQKGLGNRYFEPVKA